MLSGLKARTIALTRGPQAEWALFAVSFAESSFFPIPPDIMLGPMAAAAPERWLRYALTCTVASVLGGLAGYAIGYFLFETVGQAIISFFGYGGREDELRAEYARIGVWVILLKGLTPIPYKLVTIVSGAMAFSLPMFIFASIATRGLRFLIVAWVFRRFGPAIAPVIEKRLGLFLLGVLALVVGIVVAMRFIPH